MPLVDPAEGEATAAPGEAQPRVAAVVSAAEATVVASRSLPTVEAHRARAVRPRGKLPLVQAVEAVRRRAAAVRLQQAEPLDRRMAAQPARAATQPHKAALPRADNADAVVRRRRRASCARSQRRANSA